jgi:hypothetical protein
MLFSKQNNWCSLILAEYFYHILHNFHISESLSSFIPFLPTTEERSIAICDNLTLHGTLSKTNQTLIYIYESIHHHPPACTRCDAAAEYSSGRPLPEFILRRTCPCRLYHQTKTCTYNTPLRNRNPDWTMMRQIIEWFADRWTQVCM